MNTNPTSLAIIVLLQLCFFSASGQNKQNAAPVDSSIFRMLVNSVGLTNEEKACLELQDKKCLFTFYQNKWASKSPLSNIVYHDTLSWKVIADSFRRRASSDMDLFFLYTRRSAIFYYLAGSARHSNFELQNLGFMYDEQVHKYDSCNYFIDLALSRWVQMKDTLFSANLYKYRAYLSTKTELVKDGIADARNAIYLYGLKGFQSGIMVSYRDLATIFIKEGQMDSANHYLYQAKKHWESEKDTSRLVDINTHLLRANFAHSQLANELVAENDLLISNTEPDNLGLINYYEAVIAYAEYSGHRTLKDRYERLKEGVK